MGSVTDYQQAREPSVRAALQRVLDRAEALVPDLQEGISYRLPALLHRGRPLIAVVETARHLAIYPFSGRVVSAVADRLPGFSLSSGTIRFAVDRPVPDDVLDDIVRLRRAEIDAGGR